MKNNRSRFSWTQFFLYTYIFSCIPVFLTAIYAMPFTQDTPIVLKIFTPVFALICIIGGLIIEIETEGMVWLVYLVFSAVFYVASLLFPEFDLSKFTQDIWVSESNFFVNIFAYGFFYGFLVAGVHLKELGEMALNSIVSIIGDSLYRRKYLVSFALSILLVITYIIFLLHDLV